MKWNLPSRNRVPCSLLVLVAVCLMGRCATTAQAQWAQWGGPNRDFKMASIQLSTAWSEDGPRRLWARELGEGYSAISAADGVLYTMYRQDDHEVVIALDANSGQTRWEYRYPAPLGPGFVTGQGFGPHATPLIVGDNVYTVGVRAELHCLERKTGEKLWSHDMRSEFGAVPPNRGYSSSPIAYHGMLILPVGGGDGHGVMAFDLDDGRVVWKSGDFPATFSSPIVVNVDGQDQLVVLESRLIAGLEPETGELLWTHPHRTQYDVNASTPVWGEGNLLFVSSAYDNGSRVIRLAQRHGKTTVEEMWYSTKMKIHHGTAVRLGDMRCDGRGHERAA